MHMFRIVAVQALHPSPGAMFCLLADRPECARLPYLNLSDQSGGVEFRNLTS
jgi:hypothetical protein